MYATSSATLEDAMNKTVWVVFSPTNGAVRSVYFREPSKVPQGSRVVQTTLSERDCQRVHQLRVVGERVFHVYSLAGI